MRRLVTRKSILPLAGILILAVVTSIGLRSAKADMIYRLLNRTAVSAKREAAKPTPTRAQVETRKSSASAFQQVVDLSAGSSAAASQPSASILADLNGDGISDLVLASSSGTLDVRLGTAGGGFQAAKSFRVEGHVDAMASGDFTSDGKLDVLVADTGADSLFILVGDGTGNLPEAQRVALNSSPSRLLVKDFVGDRRAELVVSTGIGPQTELLLWQDVAWTKSMSDSELQFVKPRTLQLPPARLKISTIGAVTRIDAGYVDADSFADILLVSEQQIQVLHGAPNSPFQKIDSVTSDSVITASASGDFNGDARLELAVLESGSEAAVIYGVDAAGQYREIQKVNVGPASGLLAADVNGDRTDDLVVLPKHARKLSILLGGSQDALGTELSNDLKVQPAVVAAGWLDSDTSADLVVAGRRALTVMLTGQLPASTTQGPVGESPIVNVVPAEIDVLIPEGECVTIPLAITIVPTVYRPMDIFLLVDASNSFTDNITNFINDGSRFVQQLVDLRGDIRLGVGTFKDYPISPFGQFLDHAYRREIDFRQVNIQNRAALSNAITRITTGGGGDDPESQLPALYQAATGEGQVLGGLLADIAPNQQASFRQNFDVEKVVVLITDSNFHNAGDPGNAGGPTYPGPTFTDTIAALRARGVKVVGIAAGGPHGGDPAITVAALQQIATATSTFARRDIDANGDGTIDVQKGDPLVVGPPTTNINLKDVIISAVRGFDLPVPLTLEFDRDCSPLTHDFSPVTLFVDPLTGGTYTFDLTFCAPCPSAPFVCRLETKIILDEIIRVRVPTTITAVRPVATVNPGALAFGDVCVGATATQTLTFGNTGNGPYTINALNSSNPAFTVISTSAALPAVVAPGGTVTATVQFSCATGPGPQAGTLIADTTPAQDCLNLGPLLPPIPLSGNCVLIAGSVSPTAVDFGQVCVGQSEVRTLTVTNTGTGPFTINTIASSNVAFSIDSPALPATVPVGGSVSVVVRFSCPSATGPQSGVITFTTSNATNCPLDLGTVALSGSCIEAAGNVAPAALDFGSVCVGQNATNTFTINNTGNTPLTINTITPSSAAFTVVSPALPVTIAPGGSTTVTVQLTCTSPGPQSATISIGASAFCGAVNVGTVSLTGLCINVAGVVSPTAIDFGSVCVGANTTRTFTVANTGNQPFNLDSIASSNAAFTIVSPALPVAIPAGGSVTVTVQLTCVTPGPQAGSLTLGASSTCGPVALSPVALSGFCASTTGTVAPVAIDFGDVCVGASSTRTFTVTNTGNSPFNLTGITSSSPAFTIISPALPVTIPAGGSTTVTVQLTCTSTGPQSGTISFAASGVCGAVSLGTVSLTGFCANVTGTVAPAVIDFGNVCVGTTATRTFVITNTGNRPFDVTSITSSNPAFAIISPAVPLTIPVGGNATVTVRLTCAAPGPQTGTIGFTANSSCGPVSLGTVSLAGFCAQVACAVSPTNLMFGDVQSGTSRDLTFTVANAGNIPFTITGIASSNPLFSIVSPAFPTTVAPGGSLTVTARFTAPPGSSGPQSATLTINTISDCGPAACSVVSATANAVLGPVCAVSPALLDLGTILINTTRTGTITISNTGDQPLIITAATSNNPRVTLLTGLPLTVPPGGSATLTIQGEAREPGLQTATLTFASNQVALPNVCSVNVRFVGVVGPQCIFEQPLGSTPDFNFDLPFPDTVVGGSTLVNGLVRILNLGDLPLVINQGGRRPVSTNLSFTVVGFDTDTTPPLAFPLDPNPAVPAPELTIPPGGELFMQLRFTGLDIGSQVGAVQLFTNERITDPNNPPCVLKNVRGVVVRPPQCLLNPTAATLNAFAACSSATQAVTLTNTGGLDLVVTAVTSTNPDFVVLDPVTNAVPVTPFTVAPGASRAFLVRFTPLSLGTSTTVIRFISNDPNPLACTLTVTGVATNGPVCQVVMPDIVNGAPDGKTFGEVVIVPMSDARFGMNVGGIQFGEKRLPIEVRNTGDAPLILTVPPAGFPSNPFLTNTNFFVEGFAVGDSILPGAARTGTVVFRPTLRRLQSGTIRFFTNTCIGECVIDNVNGVGISNALCVVPPNLNVGSAPAGGSVVGAFLLINRGDRELRIDNPGQIVIDNPVFTVTNPLPIVVPPEFSGGDAGVAINVRFAPVAAGQQIGKITLNYTATNLGPVDPCSVNLSGTGTPGAPTSIVNTVDGLGSGPAGVSVPVVDKGRQRRD